ncbi:MAG: IS66 family insertion sequence element accessory protein TnpA [Terracidiphilus sp.]
MHESGLPSKQESRIEWWRRVIFRQRSATVPLTQFCRQMGVSTRKFYYWRQRLREMDAASSGSQITPSGSMRSASTVSRDAAAAFLPVSIIDRSTTTELEIELANGCAVRLKGSVDVGLLQAAISAAGELNGPGRGDH